MQNFVTIFRLHRMHELQTIVTDVCGVCLSVMRYAATLCDVIWCSLYRFTLASCLSSTLYHLPVVSPALTTGDQILFFITSRSNLSKGYEYLFCSCEMCDVEVW